MRYLLFIFFYLFLEWSSNEASTAVYLRSVPLQFSQFRFADTIISTMFSCFSYFFGLLKCLSYIMLWYQVQLNAYLYYNSLATYPDLHLNSFYYYSLQIIIIIINIAEICFQFSFSSEIRFECSSRTIRKLSRNILPNSII